MSNRHKQGQEPLSQQSPPEAFSLETVRPPAHQRDDNPDVKARLNRDETKEKGMSRRKLLGGFLGGAVLAGTATGAAVFGLRETGQEVTPNPKPTAAGPANPGKEPSAEPTNPTEKEKPGELAPGYVAEIPKGLEAKEYVNTYLDSLEQWYMGPTEDPKNYDRLWNDGEDPLVIAAEYTDSNANALFIPDWRADPVLTKTAQNNEYFSNVSIGAWYLVESGRREINSDDPEYTYSIEMSEFVRAEENEDGRVFHFYSIEHNNIAEADSDPRIPARYPELAGSDGQEVAWQLGTKYVEGEDGEMKEKIFQRIITVQEQE